MLSRLVGLFKPKPEPKFFAVPEHLKTWVELMGDMVAMQLPFCGFNSPKDWGKHRKTILAYLFGTAVGFGQLAKIDKEQFEEMFLMAVSPLLFGSNVIDNDVWLEFRKLFANETEATTIAFNAGLDDVTEFREGKSPRRLVDLIGLRHHSERI